MKIPARLLARIRKVRAKRPRTVLDHILKHGQITTQELRDLYGYNHPPRAVRDVREHGIPLETFRVVGPDGRKIAAYRIAMRAARRGAAPQGRRAFSKRLKELLVARDGPRCQVCWTGMEARYLQIDHRVPYEVAGEDVEPEAHPEKFMLLCSSCNRAKSWSCEHCENWRAAKQVTVCKTCYWAGPQSYSHIAMAPQRRVELIWTGAHEVRTHDRVWESAQKQGRTVQEVILEIIARHEWQDS
jgi:hypothetical protein